MATQLEPTAKKRGDVDAIFTHADARQQFQLRFLGVGSLGL